MATPIPNDWQLIGTARPGAGTVSALYGPNGRHGEFTYNAADGSITQL